MYGRKSMCAILAPQWHHYKSLLCHRSTDWRGSVVVQARTGLRPSRRCFRGRSSPVTNWRPRPWPSALPPRCEPTCTTRRSPDWPSSPDRSTVAPAGAPMSSWRPPQRMGVPLAANDQLQEGVVRARWNGHTVYTNGDPRFRPLLELAEDALRPDRRALLAELLSLVRSRDMPPPNCDLALAVMSWAATGPTSVAPCSPSPGWRVAPPTTSRNSANVRCGSGPGQSMPSTIPTSDDVRSFGTNGDDDHLPFPIRGVSRPTVDRPRGGDGSRFGPMGEKDLVPVRLAVLERVLNEPPMIHPDAPNGSAWRTSRRCYEFLAQESGPGSRTLETGAGLSTVLF